MVQIYNLLVVGWVCFLCQSFLTTLYIESLCVLHDKDLKVNAMIFFLLIDIFMISYNRISSTFRWFSRWLGYCTVRGTPLFGNAKFLFSLILGNIMWIMFTKNYFKISFLAAAGLTVVIFMDSFKASWKLCWNSLSLCKKTMQGS